MEALKAKKKVSVWGMDSARSRGHGTAEENQSSAPGEKRGTGRNLMERDRDML